MKRLDGVIMINFWPALLTCSSTAHLSDVVRHILYVSNLIGSEHVGLGSDFDGIPQVPIGLEDVSKYPALLQELLNMGMTPSQIEGIAHGNFLRIFDKTEQVARELRHELPQEAKDPFSFPHLKIIS